MKLHRIRKSAWIIAPILIECYLYTMVLPQPQPSVSCPTAKTQSSQRDFEKASRSSRLSGEDDKTSNFAFHPFTHSPLHPLTMLDRLLTPLMSLVGSPAAADQVTIQPGSEGKDALVVQMQGGNNYGSDAALYSGMGPDYGGGEKRSYLQFDLSSIPQGATINSATLSLYVGSAAGGGQTAGAYNVTGSWEEGSLTWNNQPSVDGSATDSTAVNSTGWKSWTVTSLVSAWHGGTATNYGVCIKQSSGSPPNNVQYRSGDYTGDTALRPKLVVDYTTGGGGAPTAVTLNNPANIQTTQLDLSWSQNADANFASYKIYRSTTTGVTDALTPITTLATQATTSFTDTGLNPNTAYYYKVYVVSAEAATAGSNEVNATTQAQGDPPPAAVTLNNPANIQTTQMNLSWSQNNDADFASYKIYRATATGVTQDSTLVTTLTTQTQTSFTVTGLNADTQYFFKVYVLDQAAQATGSNEVNATTNPPDAPPTAVTLNTPTGGMMNEVNLSWSQNGDMDFQSYKVYRSITPGVTEQSTLILTNIQSQLTSGTDMNAPAAPAPGNTYYYKVFVYDQANQGTGSNEQQIAKVDAAPATVTLNAADQITQNSLHVSWNQSWEMDFQKYEVHRSTTQTFAPDATTLRQTYTLSNQVDQWENGLAANTTYYYKVLVFDTVNQSAASNEITATTQGDAPPTAVTLNVPTGGMMNEVNLSWSQNGDMDFQAYKVYRSTTPGVTEVSTLITTINEQGTINAMDWNAPAAPAPGNTYYYKVFVYDQANQGTGSNEQQIAKVDAAPAAVTLNAADQITQNSLHISWNQSWEMDFQKYEVHRSTTQTFTPDATTLRQTYTQSNQVDYSDMGLAANTTYYYKVLVYDAANQSTASNEITATTQGDAPPTAVTLNTPTGGMMNEVNLSWSQNGDMDFASYKVYRSTTAGVTEQSTLITTINQQGTINAMDWNAPAAPAPGNTYYYKVFVYDQANQGTGSNEQQIAKVDAAPAAVTLNAADQITQNSLHISWTQSWEMDFQKYEVHRATTVNFIPDPSSLIQTITTSNQVDRWENGLAANTTYYYKVLVFDTANQSTASNEIATTTAADVPPAAVTLNVPAGGMMNEVNLSWSQNGDMDFQAYKVYRSITPGVTEASTLITTINQQGTTNTMDGNAPAAPAPGNTYYYKVFVYDQANQGTGSDEQQIVRINAAPPAVTLNAADQITQTQIHISWSQNTDMDFQKYEVHRSATANFVPDPSSRIATITQSNQIDYTDAWLAPNTTYHYKVVVFDAVNQSTASNEVTATTQAAAVPTAVTLNNPGNIQTTQMDLSWSLNADPNFQSYKIYRSTTAGVTEASTLVTTLTIQPQTTFTDTGLQPQTNYYYKVYVVNTMAATAGSNEVPGTTPAAGGPPPTAVTLNNPTNVQTTQMTLSWSQNADGNFATYKLYRSATPGVTEQSTLVATLNPSSVISHQDTNLQPNTAYHYRIFVVNTENVSAGSNEVTETTLADAPPTAVTLNQPTDVQSLQMTLSWTQNADADFARYQVYRSTTPGVTEASILAATITQQASTAVTVSGLTPDTHYYFKVFVIDQANHNSASNEADATTAVDPLPTAVTVNPVANIQAHQVDLSWSQNADADFASYKVYRSTTPGVTEQSTLVATLNPSSLISHQVTNLNPNTTYYYRVFVIDQANQATGSNEVDATTQADPPPTVATLNTPTSITANGLTLTWSLNQDADFQKYEVRRSTATPVTAASDLVFSSGQSSVVSCQVTELTPQTQYFFKVFVVDQANQAVGSNEVDATTAADPAPVVTFTAVNQSPVVEGQTPVVGGSQATVTVHYTDDVAVRELRFYVPDGPPGDMPMAFDPPQQAGDATFTYDTTQLTNGTHTFNVTAFDTANPSNQHTYGLQFTANNPSPTVSISAPLANSAVEGMLSVVGAFANTLPADKPISKVQLYVDNTFMGPVAPLGPPPVNIPPYNVNPPTLTGNCAFTWDTSLVKNGQHTLIAYVYDTRPSAANFQLWQSETLPDGVGQTTVAINVNNPLPTVTIDSVNQSAVGSGQNAVVSSRFTPVVLKFHTNQPNNSKITKVELFKDNVLVPFMPDTYSSGYYTDVAQDQPVTSGEYRIMVDFSNDTAGAHTLQAKATDAVGNEGVGNTVNVTVEAAAPTISITSISGSPIPPFSQSPTPAVTVVGNSMTADIKYKSNSGKGVQTLQLWLDHTENTPFGEGGTGTLVASQTLAPLLGTDSFGNPLYVANPAALQGTQTFTIDTTAWTDGSHTLAAVAIEKKSDGTTYSQGVSNHQPLTINHAGTDAPPVSVYLSASNVTDASALLSWTASSASDFLKYEIHKSTTQGFTPDASTLVGADSDRAHTAFHLAPLTSGTTYYLKVVVWDNANQNSASNEAAVTTLSPSALLNDPPAGTVFVLEMNKFDAAGQLIATWDGNGNITQFEYGNTGRQTKVIDALGNQTVTAYDAAGRRTSTTDALNHTTTFAYDNANRLTAATDALNNASTFGYDAAGNQVSVTNARGYATTKTYNSRNRVLSMTDSLANTTLFTYDAVGNKLTETNALNQATTMAYNALNRLISQTDPMNHVTTFAFDAVGNQTSITDANGKVTLSAYNLRNLRTTETNAASGVTTYGYDAVGNKTTVTDAKGATWTYAFDWASREKSMTQPDNTVEKKVYDAVGNLIAKQKPDSNIIRYSYDSLNRLILRDYPTGTDTTFAFDALGRRTQMVDSTGTSTYTYDALGRLTTYTQPCGAESKTITYTFDQVGNRLSMVDPDNTTQTYVYDANNRLTSTTAPGAGTAAYIYDAIGRVTRQNNGNGTYVLNTFDAAGRITLLENKKSDNSLLSSFAYTVDNVGNRTGITESVLGTDNATYQNATVNYGYDNIYRLTSEHRTGYTPFWYEYQYDGAGNRLALTQKDGGGNVTGTTNSTYDAANKLLTSGNITYTWDLNGNQTSKTVNGQTTSNTWDFEDKMTQLQTPTLTTTFATDGEGFRRGLSDGTVTTRFVYDRSNGMPGLDPLILETDANGTATVHYSHANGLVSQTRSGATLWYAYEAIGTTRQLTDNSQLVTDSYAYEAFGNMAASTGSTPNPFQYVGNFGYYNDGQSGLVLLGVRYYCSFAGTLFQKDPARKGWNWFLYARGTPVLFIDKTGLAEMIVCGGFPNQSPGHVGLVCGGMFYDFRPGDIPGVRNGNPDCQPIPPDDYIDWEHRRDPPRDCYRCTLPTGAAFQQSMCSCVTDNCNKQKYKKVLNMCTDFTQNCIQYATMHTQGLPANVQQWTGCIDGCTTPDCLHKCTEKYGGTCTHLPPPQANK